MEILLILASLVCLVNVIHTSVPAASNSFLLAGQSNMAGRGGVTNITGTNQQVWDGFVPPECQPNQLIVQLDANLYNRMVERAKASTSRGGRLRALWWFQGGADADMKEDAVKYQSRLLKFFNNFRKDIDFPELPIVQVAIAPGKKPFSDRVRQAQLSLQLPYLVTVDSYELPVGPDNVHLTTPSQVKLGRILADAYFPLNSPDP